MMLMEHEEGRGYVRAMAGALDGWEKRQEASQAVVIENARAYVRLLREQFQKEDEILFHMADEVLIQRDQEILLRQFEEREVKEIGTGVYEM